MKKGSPILDYLKEITIVVIGVLIAVSIGNYKERVDNERYIEKTLLAVEKEIKLSQPDLDTVFNRHLQLFEILRDKLEGAEPVDPELTIGKLISNSGGFQVAFIQNVSLRFFVNNKAELLEFGIISQLLEIEAISDLLKEKTKRLTSFCYENIDRSGEKVLLRLAYLLSDLLDSEKTLLASYSEFLKQHQQKLEKE